MPTAPKHIFANRTRTIVLSTLLLMAVVLLTTAGLVYRGANQAVIAKVVSSEPAAAVAAQGRSLSPRLEAERVTVRPTGFEPKEITRPAGRFLLAVNDRTGVDGIALALISDSGQRLHATRMRDNPRKHEWRQVMNLPPGRYVLKEANHPEWTCRITLTAN